MSFADDVRPYRQGKSITKIADSMQLNGPCTDHKDLPQPSKPVALWCSLNNHSVKAVGVQTIKACYSPASPGALWCSLNNHAVKAVMSTVSIGDQELE